MSIADKRDGNTKLIVVLILLFIGINGLLTLLAEKAYQSMGDDSAYFFQLNWWVSGVFTVLVFAILSGFLAQFSSVGRCLATFVLLLVFKAVFAGSTLVAFHFAGPYKESIAQAASASAFSSLPAAIIHIFFAFISMLFIKPFSLGEKHEDDQFHIEMPSFDMPKMDAARPKLRSTPDMELAGQENFPHPIDHDQRATNETTTDFGVSQPDVGGEVPSPPPVEIKSEPKPEAQTPPAPSAPPLIQKPSSEPLLMSSKPDSESTQKLLNSGASGPPSLSSPTSVPENQNRTQSFEITLADILDQIDARNFNCPEDQLGDYKFRVDSAEIIPQLPEGKVIVSAEQVLMQAPNEILRMPVAEIIKKIPEGKIALPLEKLIKLLPAETFSLPFTQESALNVDNIPDPFQEGEHVEEEQNGSIPIVHSIPGSAAPELQADLTQQQQPPETRHEQPQPVEPQQPSRLEQSIAAAATSQDEPAEEQPRFKKEMPETLQLNLAYIISRLPENSLVVTFAQLQDKIKTPGKLEVATQIIAPQVQTGKVLLTAEQIIAMFPAGCISKSEQELARGLPEGGVELPLNDIVEQLPEEFFKITDQDDAADVDKMAEIFKDPGHALAPEDKSPILTDIQPAPEETLEMFERFIQDQEPHEQQEQVAETTEHEKDQRLDPDPAGLEQSIDLDIVDSNSDQESQPKAVEDTSAVQSEEQPADQVAGLMNGVESTLSSKVEPEESLPEESLSKDKKTIDIEEITNQTAADEIINDINQTNMIFPAGMKLYRFQNTFITTLVRPGLETRQLVEPLPEVISSLVLFTEQTQLGGLKRIAFVSQTGAIDLEFPGSPVSGKWILLADNKSQSLGILFKYFNAHCDRIQRVFDAPGSENLVFSTFPLLNESENKYHIAGNLTASIDTDLPKKFALSRTGGYHWEVMQQNELYALDQSPDSFELLEPVLRYTASARWGQSMLIVLRTEEAVLALTQPAWRDTMSLMMCYLADTSEGTVAYEAAKACSLVEESL